MCMGVCTGEYACAQMCVHVCRCGVHRCVCGCTGVCACVQVLVCAQVCVQVCCDNAPEVYRISQVVLYNGPGGPLLLCSEALTKKETLNVAMPRASHRL